MCQAITEGRALDIIEVDAASNRGIDEIRDLREKTSYAPNQALYKVYIIDEVHMLTKEASNALLKTLEEPPPHIIFILATTEAHKILPTIMSRCQRFDFRRISQADISAKLARICDSEGFKAEPEALRLIAKAVTGSLRDAENLLQQLTTYYGAEIGLQQTQAILGISGDPRTGEVTRHIINKDVSSGIAVINSVNNDGVDLRHFNRELVEYLRMLLLVKTGSSAAIDLTAEDMKELKELAAKALLPQILKAVKLFGQLELGFDNYSTLPLELALVECTLHEETAADKGEKVAHREVEEPKKRATAESTPQPPAAKQKSTDTTPARKAEPVPEKVTAEPTSPPPAAKQKPTETIPAREAEPTPESATGSTHLPDDTESDIEHLRLNLKQSIKDAPDNISRTPAAALLRSAIPTAVAEDTIVLSFKFPFYKEKMEELENQKIAEKIISLCLGRTCRVRCVYEPEANHLVNAALKMGAQIIDEEER